MGSGGRERRESLGYFPSDSSEIRVCIHQTPSLGRSFRVPLSPFMFLGHRAKRRQADSLTHTAITLMHLKGKRRREGGEGK